MAGPQLQNRVDPAHRAKHEWSWIFDPANGERLRNLEPDPHCDSLHGGYRALNYNFCPSCGNPLSRKKKK